MNRRSFFKKSAVIVGAAVIAPSVALKAVESLGKKPIDIPIKYNWKTMPSSIMIDKNKMAFKTSEELINRYWASACKELYEKESMLLKFMSK
jgi:hypothetical protein